MAWRTSSAATWPTPCSLASRSSYSALGPFWAFLLCCWLLGGFQSWGLQATSKPTQLTSCPGPPAILQLFQGIAGAWSPWGLCLLLDTPGLLQELLPFPTYVRGWSISILASTKGQPPGHWLLLKFTMMDQLPEGQYPLEGHLPALTFRFFLSQPFSNRPHTSSSLNCFLWLFQPAKNKNNGPSKWTLYKKPAWFLPLWNMKFGSGIMAL